MTCFSANGLVLDETSKRAIEEIRRKERLADKLAIVLSAGVLINILSTRQPIQMSYNIYQTDFQAFSDAMHSVPPLLKREVENIAARQLMRALDPKQKSFWQGVYYGCK